MMHPPRTTPERFALLDRLESEVLDLQGSAAWARYLSAQARFHRYSPRNVMLITMQRPDASHVAGFGTWRTLGRTVREGEQAISILAPMITTDEEGGRAIRGFRWVSVFDIAQTEGAELPQPVQILEGEDPGRLEDRLVAVAEELGLSVERSALAAGVNGELRWSSATIVLAPENPAVQRIKTLAHELGHALLHRHEPDRARAEIEAESVAYVVLANLGLDSSPYSAGYLSSWIGNEGDVREAIRRSCTAISTASQRILEILERRAAPRSSQLHIAS